MWRARHCTPEQQTTQQKVSAILGKYCYCAREFVEEVERLPSTNHRISSSIPGSPVSAPWCVRPAAQPLLLLYECTCNCVNKWEAERQCKRCQGRKSNHCVTITPIFHLSCCINLSGNQKLKHLHYPKKNINKCTAVTEKKQTLSTLVYSQTVKEKLLIMQSTFS